MKADTASPDQHTRGLPRNAGCVIRIELSASRRRRLGDMARDANMSADDLASRLLSCLIDDDAVAHGETP